MIKSHFNFKSDIDCLAHNIYNLYMSELEKNNFRIFAKDVDFKLYAVDEYELNAFKSYFKTWFKTDAQLLKTKHIKSDALSIDLPDFYDRIYTVNFVVYKNQYSTTSGYLDEIYNHFLIAIENKVKNKNKVDVEVWIWF